MYGLTKNEDLSFLLEKELIQVCIGSHQSILRFCRDTSICLECAFDLSNLERVGDESCAPRAGADSLPKLLGSRIINVVNRGGGELAITFSGGFTLTIYDSNSNTESYQISDSTRMIVV